MLNRPLLWVALSLTAGTLAASGEFLHGATGAALLCSLGFVLFVVCRGRYTVAIGGIMLAFFGTGALLWDARHLGPPGDALSRLAILADPDTEYVLTGTVRSSDIVLPGRGYIQFQFDVDSQTRKGLDEPIQGGVLVGWSDPAFPVYSGTRLRLTGTLEHALGRINPGVSSVEDYFRRNHLNTRLRLRGAQNIQKLEEGKGLSPVYLLSRLRSRVAVKLSEAVPERALPFVLAVWLGDRRGLSEKTYNRFVASGTAHVLAVSGVHVGIVYLTLAALLSRLIPARRIRVLVTMLAVFAFVLLAGGRISSLRAGFMIALYLLAELFDREPDAPTALSLAAIVFVLHDSDVVLDAGFQLSFTAVASLLIFHPRIAEFFSRVPRSARGALSAVIAVQILPLLLAISIFHIFPLAGPLANLVVIPLLVAVLWLCFLTTLFSFLLPPAAFLFGNAMVPEVFLIDWITENVSQMNYAFVRLSPPSLLSIFLYWGFLVCLLRAFNSTRAKTRWRVAAGLAFALTFLCWNGVGSEPQVTFLDVGHGDATFIRTPGGTTILVDGGDFNENAYTNRGERVVAPFLRSNHVARLDVVVATHSDTDHMGGLRYILNNFAVGALYLGPFAPDTGIEKSIVADCQRLGIPIRRVARNDFIPVKQAKLEVLHPPRDWPISSTNNDRSLVLKLSWPSMSVLLTGDIEAEAERAVVSADCRAAILKVPHHGSDSSSTESFVRAVRPQYAVVSTGQPRRVANDHILKRYSEAGASVYRTDVFGGIRFTASHGQIHAEAARPSRGYAVRAGNL